MEPTKLETCRQTSINTHLKAVFLYETSLHEVGLSSFLKSLLSSQQLVLVHINRGGKNKFYLKLI